MKRSRKWLPGFCAVLAGLFLLAGCSGSDYKYPAEPSYEEGAIRTGQLSAGAGETDQNGQPKETGEQSRDSKTAGTAEETDRDGQEADAEKADPGGQPGKAGEPGRSDQSAKETDRDGQTAGAEAGADPGEAKDAAVYSGGTKPVGEDANDPAGPGAELDEYGVYTSMEDVALYLYLYEELPDNFITKKEAQALGWEGGSLEPYAPGMCIGGDYFGNYEGNLPKEKSREYHECDIDTLGARGRGAKRIVYSNDGLIYYTEDHYETFTLLYGEE